jgi:dolichol-phosphate mannosyltransferase
MHSRHPPLVSVVVPVFNEAQVIQEFHQRISEVAQQEEHGRYRIIYVDDGSTDDSHQLLCKIAQFDERVRVIKLSRNFGHQPALTAGLDYAEGDAVVFIDADLQDPPEVIPRLVEKWQEGFDVVYARRLRRHGESKMKLLTAKAFYQLIGAMSQVQIPEDVGDFRLISKKVADQLRSMRERDRYLRGLSSWVGFRQTAVHYDRDQRFAGSTKFSYRKMLKFAVDGITSFSNAPLKLATWFGFGTAFLSFLYLLSVFVQKFMGYTVDGWATIMVAILFVGGIQLICLGIFGAYLGRVFNEVKARPIYIVDETLEPRPDVLTLSLKQDSIVNAGRPAQLEN